MTALPFEPSGVTPPLLDAYAALLSDVFGPSPKFDPQAIAWRYRDNPAGAVVGMDAWDGDRLAAHYVTSPVETVVEGQAMTGLLSLNTATHPDYQGRGLFTSLAEQAYALGAAAGHDFVVGVANANSTPGFLRKLGFQLVAPLNAGALLATPRRMTPRPLQYEARWSEALLRWRIANPAGSYAVGRSGDLLAVRAKTSMPAIRCAAFLPGSVDVAGISLRNPLAANLFIGLEPRLDLGAHGYVPVPARLRPSPLNLIWRPLSPRAPKTLDAAAVALSFLDFDPY